MATRPAQRNGIEHGGMSRRELMRAAVATGVATWAAPVIIGSIASPAAALSPPHGCTFVVFNGGSCNVDNQGTPCNTLPDCTSNPAIAGCLEVVPVGGKCQDAGVIVNNLCAGVGCKITFASAKAGDDCYTPAQTIGGFLTDNQVRWGTTPNGKTYNQFAIFLTCT